MWNRPPTLQDEVRARAEAYMLAQRVMALHHVNVLSGARAWDVGRARWLVMFVLRRRGYSTPMIARAVGLKDHTSVLHGLRRVSELGLETAADDIDYIRGVA